MLPEFGLMAPIAQGARRHRPLGVGASRGRHGLRTNVSQAAALIPIVPGNGQAPACLTRAHEGHGAKWASAEGDLREALQR
jgi:hypothetical protein